MRDGSTARLRSAVMSAMITMSKRHIGPRACERQREDVMSDTLLIVLVIVAIVVVAALVYWFWSVRRRDTGSAGEALAPPPAARIVSTGKLEVTAVHHGSVDDAGEWVMLVNNGFESVQLQGWKLTDDGPKHSYTFPGIVLAPNARLRIHMAAGDDSASDLYVGRRQHWWNNAGDTAYLYDASGTLVHVHSY
jgi:hypothetical protein